jgi:hypothetical protein
MKTRAGRRVWKSIECLDFDRDVERALYSTRAYSSRQLGKNVARTLGGR